MSQLAPDLTIIVIGAILFLVTKMKNNFLDMFKNQFMQPCIFKGSFIEFKLYFGSSFIEIGRECSFDLLKTIITNGFHVRKIKEHLTEIEEYLDGSINDIKEIECHCNKYGCYMQSSCFFETTNLIVFDTEEECEEYLVECYLNKKE